MSSLLSSSPLYTAPTDAGNIQGHTEDQAEAVPGQALPHLLAGDPQILLCKVGQRYRAPHSP